MRSVTTDNVEKEALGALGWIEGYTEPQADRPQLRVDIIDSAPSDPENSLRVTFRESRYDPDGEQQFKITVSVEAIDTD